MLQAPTNDRKTKAEASSKTAEYLPEYEQSSQLMGGIGRSRQSQPLQQRENLAALQKAYGNQAILRMKGRSPTVTASPLNQGGVLQRKCACSNSVGTSGTCAECQKKGEEFLLRGIQTKLEPATATAYSSPMESSRLPGNSGRPLGRVLAQHFRSSLGSLIDRVSIHDDTQGNQFAARQGAVAVTSGTDIYFAKQAYQPQTTAGRNLLAHELAHVHQQHRSNGPPQGYQSRPGDVFEQEADRFAQTGIMSSSTTGIATVTSNVYQNRTAAEQIATILRSAVEGWGTDEEAIFNALTGRTPTEITEIEAAYEALSGGERLEDRLRSELSGQDLSRALSLLKGETAATETARRLWDAMGGLGTDEEAIYAAVGGRTAEQWTLIQQAYQEMGNASLMSDLRDELNDSEWQYLQTLLPEAAGGAVTEEDRATVIANRLEAAVEGLGTDETAIYAALTGHSDAELREIEWRFQLLTGQELDARLRDELTDSEYARVQELLHPVTNPERIAIRLREALQGLGTRELAILAILSGHSPDELTQVRNEYRRLYSESLEERLRAELSGGDLIAALKLLQAGVLEPEDEIKLAVQGLGTDEERLFAVLRELNADPNSRTTIQTTIDRYAKKGYGDMLEDIRNDLFGADLERALELLHGTTPTTTCSSDQRSEALEAISVATSMAQNAESKLVADISAGRLSSGVRTALEANFNPGKTTGAVNLALAGQVRGVLYDARTDLLTRSQVTCTTPVPMPCTPELCVSNPDCSDSTAAWTCTAKGSIVRICPAFFKCPSDKPTTMLHEFVHHIGIDDKFYKHEERFSRLTPIGNKSANDSLDNADSYAYFAKDLQ